MNLQETYAALGGDLKGTLNRLRKESLVCRMAKRYPADPSYREFVKAMELKDPKEAFRAVHTIKGTSATLGFTPLYEEASILSDMLREGWNEKAIEESKKLASVYDKTLQALEALE